MAICFYSGTSSRGNQIWGDWVCSDIRSIEDNMVKYCRRAFGKRYKDMWVNPVYFDDRYFRYTDEFFSEVGAELYPKLTNLSKELKRRGIKLPKTKEEWVDYSAIVWEIVHNDIAENIRKGVKPVNVVVKGVRYSKNKSNSYDTKFEEKIKSVQVVNKLKEAV